MFIEKAIDVLSSKATVGEVFVDSHLCTFRSCDFIRNHIKRDSPALNHGFCKNVHSRIGA